MLSGRARYDDATRRYVARRVEEGKTRSEIIRCLKRFVARGVFGAMVNPPDDIATGADVREARTAAGITLTRLAIAIGVTPTNLSRRERCLEQNTKRTRLALDRLADLNDPAAE